MPNRRLLLALLVGVWAVHGHVKQHRTILRTTRVNDTENCTIREEKSDFPEDLFTLEERRHGAVLFHVLAGLYCFVVIAYVCNDYFLPSMDCICQDLNLSKDVAGATFMAFATSAPELFVNIIGTFLTESDLGIGTVVGSAVFNTLGVAACGGLAARMLIPLEVWPLARDCGIYMFVISALTLILWDEKIEWFEALTLLLLYVVYCFALFCQQRLQKAAKSVLRTKNALNTQISTVALTCNTDLTGTYRPFHHHGEIIGWEKRPSVMIKPDEINNIEKTVEVTVEVRAFSPPSGIVAKLWWLASWPVAAILYLTLPDCRMNRRLYPLTFLMSVVWIGITSYIVSWMMTVIGDTLNISDSVMGLTLVAIGGSIPEASTSVINARHGIGSMTISNALGGNTLDILLSLGLPWFIKTLLPVEHGGGPVLIESRTVVYNNAAQLACVALLFVTAAFNSFTMDRTLGFTCLTLYLMFICFIVAIELDVFGLKRPQPCLI